MTQYRLKNSAVQAIRYTGQHVNDLPEFIREFTANTPMSGESNVGRNLVGSLLVPHAGGYYTAHSGDWLIRKGTNLSVLRHEQFVEQYEAVDGSDVSVIEDVVPAPVIEPSPTAPVTDIARTADGPAINSQPTASAPVIEPAPTSAAPAPVTETTSDASEQQ